MLVYFFTHLLIIVFFIIFAQTWFKLLSNKRHCPLYFYFLTFITMSRCLLEVALWNKQKSESTGAWVLVSQSTKTLCHCFITFIPPSLHEVKYKFNISFVSFLCTTCKNVATSPIKLHKQYLPEFFRQQVSKGGKLFNCVCVWCPHRVPGLRKEQVLPLVQPQYGSLEARQLLRTHTHTHTC